MSSKGKHERDRIFDVYNRERLRVNAVWHVRHIPYKEVVKNDLMKGVGQSERQSAKTG